MKKVFTILCSVFMLGLGTVMAQGLENFANFTETGSSYVDGTFQGQDGSTWSYTQCRGDRHLDGQAPGLGKKRPVTAKVISGTIQNGCGVLSFQYRQLFSTAVNLNVFVNGSLVKNVTSAGGSADTLTIYNSGDIEVNLNGDFQVVFKQADSSNSGQVAIDNITWTAYSAGPLPEPTEYPGSFAAAAALRAVSLTWIDAAGSQPPQKYLIRVSTQNNIQAPVDGTPVADDLDVTDGTGAKNIGQGVQAYTFEGLADGQIYYFAIYPYTNLGTDINYKTDGTVPSTNATTPAYEVLSSQNFEGGSLDPWTQFSVLGDQVWTYSSQYGVGGSACGKMSGYEGAPYANEDWLISPALNLTNTTNEKFSFQSAKNYTGNPMEVYVSSNYTGSGDPNLATWSPLTATLSAGSWAWTESGLIDIATYGENIYLGFKFTSTATESATWEVDEIMILGIREMGIDQPVKLSNRVYPSPASGSFTVVFHGKNQGTMKIYDLTGSLTLSENLTVGNNLINISGLTSGLYLVKIEENGGAVSTHKLIVK